MPRRPQRRLPLTERIKDGRIYHKSGTSRAGIIYLHCKYTTICGGTAKIVNGEIVDGHPHSEQCVPDFLEQLKARFKEVLAEALSRHWYHLKDLYDTTALAHPEAAAYVTFPSIRSFMKNRRRRQYPQNPANLREFADRLADPQYARNLEYNNAANSRLSVRLVTDDTNNDHVLFFDENFVRTEMQDVDRIFIDGTFKSRPNIPGVSQLVTVMGVKLNHGFPFIWIVMSRKTESAYVSVLRYIRENIIPNNNIRLVMTDFERGLRNAIEEVLPTAHNTGCNTHYDRALYQKAKSIGLQNILRHDADAKLFFKEVLVLAYLPANLIDDQFERIKNELPVNLKHRFRAFLQYYRRYWLNVVKPHGFSVYGLGRRTNNVIESYHFHLGHRMQARPAPWDFVCKLLRLQANVIADIRRLANNGQIGRHARYSTIFKQRHLLRAWGELHRREITVTEFMRKAVALKGDVGEIIAQTSNNVAVREEDELRDQPRAMRLEDDPDYDLRLFAEEPPQWLIDNAADDLPLAPDIRGNDYYSASDSSGDEEGNREREALLPVVIDEEIPALPEINGDNDNGRQTPPPIVIDEEMAEFPEIIQVHDEDGQRTPPRLIDIDEEMAVLPEIVPINDEDGQQTPPRPIDFGYIDDEIPEFVGIVRENNDERQIALPIVADNEIPLPRDAGVVNNNRPQPPPEAIGRRRRNRQKKKRQVAHELVAPAQPATMRNKNKNKRRLELRKNAALREQTRMREIDQLRNEAAEAAVLRTETVRLRAQLEDAQEQIRLAEENAMCLMCRENMATHAYIGCGHRLACERCATRLWDMPLGRGRFCPLCRTPSEIPPQRIYQGGE